MPDFSKALRQIRPEIVTAKTQRHLFQPENPAGSLSQQLQYLKLKQPASQSRSVENASAAIPTGEEEVTPFGRHHVVRSVFDGNHWHGKVRLGRFSCSDLQQLMTLLHEKANAPDRDSIVFLDTETTGLQGGTGMVPFLVGVGYFEGDSFHMVQFFIRDFDEESSMLHALGKLLERFQLIVTYNGASFDVPLLETRFTLARFDNPLAGMPHFDLLAGARRLWRNGHGSCRLVALEREIAAFLRGKDVPGARIPRVYFDFVNSGTSPELPGVFTHNVYDVISLAALTVCACDRVVDEPAPLDNPLDLYSLSRILENSVEWKRCRTLYETALHAGLPEPISTRAAENLAVIYRRSGEHASALEICLKLMRSPSFSLAAYEGAAIHYERIERDHARALEIVEEALCRVAEIPEQKRRKALLDARRERLRQKVIYF
jgi:uncharacterized protein YprB with RNaseH-like and TPR domain